MRTFCTVADLMIGFPQPTYPRNIYVCMPEEWRRIRETFPLNPTRHETRRQKRWAQKGERRAVHFFLPLFVQNDDDNDVCVCLFSSGAYFHRRYRRFTFRLLSLDAFLLYQVFVVSDHFLVPVLSSPSFLLAQNTGTPCMVTDDEGQGNCVT